MKLLFLLIVTVVVTGCATIPCEPEIRFKEVPKIIYKQPPIAPKTEMPPLPINDLKQGDDADTVAKAYVATVELLRGYSKKLEIILEPYQNVREN